MRVHRSKPSSYKQDEEPLFAAAESTPVAQPFTGTEGHGLTDILQLLHLQEEWRRQDEKECHTEAKEQEAARHREWVRMENRKLDLEEKRLEQMVATDEARQEEEHHKELERKREREMDRKLKEFVQLPRMTEDEDIELYISSFEKRRVSIDIPRERWVDNLCPLMSNWATQVIEVMDHMDERDYQKVKETLLQAFASSKGLLGLRALAPQWKKGQTVAQFIAQQQRLLRKWLQDCTITEVAAKIAMVQTEQALPYGCRNYLHAYKPKSPTEMVTTEVEHFFATWSIME